jgi:hypothetical protein
LENIKEESQINAFPESFPKRRFVALFKIWLDKKWSKSNLAKKGFSSRE